MKSEFDFIQHIRNRASAVRSLQSAVRFGIGDDCAILSKDAKKDLVMTTDLLVEEIDFRLDWATPESLGHKALAVSLSDVAAMGAKPVWAMLSIGVPAKIWKTKFVEKFYDGWFKLAEEFSVELIGGDVSRTPDKIVIDSIVAGEVKKGKAVLRSNARVGDLIFVSGELGGASAGLKLLESGERSGKSKFDDLLVRQLKPRPQTEIGCIIGEKNLATAMIDLSDGLSSDLAHLCSESKVGAKIFADKIPFDSNFKKLNQSEKYKNLFSDRLDFALNGGEDFELLFTANPKKKFQVEKALKNLNFSHIGEVTANVEMIELSGTEKSSILQADGFRHF